MFPTSRIFGSVRNDPESVLGQQRFVFRRSEAGVVERLAVVLADCFTVLCATGEQEQGRGLSVFTEYRKHVALIGMVEMKKAVPRDQPVEFGCQ